MRYEVSAYPANDYGDGLTKAVAAHFEALRLGELVNASSKVVLKPNLLIRRSPDAATTTHPAMLSAVIDCLGKLGVTNIVIADSPGGPYIRQSLEGVYNTCGMASAAEKGAKLNFDTSSREVQGGEGWLCRSFEIISPVLDADLIINLPKLKTHAMMGLSAGVKNLFGCIPGLRKAELHLQFPKHDLFSQMLVELAQVLPPVVSIVDAVVSMEGDGPSAGSPRRTGMTFASRDIFALDFALCDFIGVKPESIGTVKYAVKQGLSPESLDEISFSGGPIPDIAPFVMPKSKRIGFSDNMPGFVRDFAAFFINNFLEPRPVIDKARCIGCKKCAESCAARAITFEDNKAVINRAKCIRCFCCHEMCPISVIDIRKSKLFRF